MGAITAYGLVALFADFFASGHPIVARVDGVLRLFPNVTKPNDLPGDLDALFAAMKPGDWYVRALVPYGPNQSRIGGEVRALRPPSRQHWLGTDRAGCDVLSRVIHGARASLGVGLCAALLSTLLGTLFGLCAGAGSGVVDALLRRVAEAFVAFPPLVFLCALQALSHDRGALGVLVTGAALATIGWPHTFHLVRTEVRRAASLDYALAARCAGASRVRVAFVHLLPAAMPVVTVAAAFAVPSAILLEASLAYLGVGLAPGTASWGELLEQAGLGTGAWWLVVFPGIALSGAAVTLLALAERARAALDPRPRWLH
jgi:peptide/nickel transport system permease protein